MDRSATVSGLIDTFYEAALEPPLWPVALERLADALRSDCATLGFFDQVTGLGSVVNARVDPAAIPAYLGHFAGRNTIRPRRNRVLGLGKDPLRWRSMVLTDEHALPKTELMRSEYYGDFLRPYGMHSLLMFGLAVQGNDFASVSIGRGVRRNQFTQSEIDTAARLQPHLIHAFGVGQRFAHMQQINSGTMELLDRFPHALLLTDMSGRVTYRNQAAETLIASRGGLSIRSGRISALESTDERKLLEAIALAAENNSARRAGTTLMLSRPGRRGLPVDVTPMRSVRTPILMSGSLVMVCASDPDSAAVVPADHLQHLFGLTRAEAKIALQLLSGLDPKQIADHLSLSIHTVRVHIARILSKTETTRQADLVRLLARISGMSSDLGR